MEAAPPTPGARGEQSYRTPGRTLGRPALRRRAPPPADHQVGAGRRPRGDRRSWPASSSALPAAGPRPRSASPTHGSARTSQRCMRSSRRRPRTSYSVEEFTEQYVACPGHGDRGRSDDRRGGGRRRARRRRSGVRRDIRHPRVRPGRRPRRAAARRRGARCLGAAPHVPRPQPGRKLERRTRTGERAPILARDGTPLAEGPATARSSPLGTSALAIAGSVGSPSKKLRDELFALGLPAEHAGGHERAGAGLQLRAAGPAERPAPGVGGGRGRRPDPRERRPGPRQAREDHDRSGGPAGRRRCAGRHVRGRGRAGRAQGRRPRDRRLRVLDSPATRVHLQGDHGHGRPGRRRRKARPTRSPSRSRTASIGREISNAHDSAVRRHLRAVLRAVVQHGLRAAGRRGRRRADVREGRALRLQLAAAARRARALWRRWRRPPAPTRCPTPT